MRNDEEKRVSQERENNPDLNRMVSSARKRAGLPREVMYSGVQATTKALVEKSRRGRLSPSSGKTGGTRNHRKRKSKSFSRYAPSG
jgi:hypothetical protein